MPEFFLELFSEEIPANMQQHAGVDLWTICTKSLSPINLRVNKKYIYGSRRIAIFGLVDGDEGTDRVEEFKGPKVNAPIAAIEGFARKHGVAKNDLVEREGVFFFAKTKQSRSASEVIKQELPIGLKRLFWLKSMRWGESGDFAWVRPLRRTVCLLDGEVVPIVLGPVTAGNETEGHRVLAPGAVAVSSAADWQRTLRARYVIVDEDERRTLIRQGLAEKAAENAVTVVTDGELLDEVNGLVEWPVPLLGQIDMNFMDLPPEVRELSMKVNQKYFATRNAAGKPAPYFAFVANLEAPDNGAAIIAGNERVLRARLSDARHFWEIDLKTPLNELLPKLEKITFHARIGTQRERAERIGLLARNISEVLKPEQRAIADQAEWAGRLCKADLVTKMVGEFPELQGIMGGYYASGNPRGWHERIVGEAIKSHYQPKGPSDTVPHSIDRISESVALADKIDTLTQFFRIGEKPTGSGDPYALRRAALGVIRIILENDLRLPLKQFFNGDVSLFNFIIERLRVKLRGEGRRFDVLDAVLGASSDDDLFRLMQRVNAVTGFLLTPDGADLLTAYRRAANILKIEDAKDGSHDADAVVGPLCQPAEQEFRDMLAYVQRQTVEDFRDGNYANAMVALSKLKTTIDVFFDRVTVNAEQPELRRNRLALLAHFRDTVHQIADFSKLEG